MRYFSAFTGVGGFDMGMPSDWECVGMSEIDKNAIKILRYRYKDVKNYGDIEKINYEELPDFELLIGGSPCQDLSIAEKRLKRPVKISTDEMQSILIKESEINGKN